VQKAIELRRMLADGIAFEKAAALVRAGQTASLTVRSLP
jgi:hypothetical protein